MRSSLAFAATLLAAACGFAQEPEGASVDAELAPAARVWGTAEYLLFWTKADRTPPLLTTGPGAAPIGVLGKPGTQVVIGGPVDFGPASGGRFTLGGWLGAGETVGVEAAYLFLGEQTAGRTVTSDQIPSLARPFYDAITGTQTSAGVSQPGVSTGGLAFTETSRLWGAGATGVFGLVRRDGFAAQATAGFRYLSLDEGLAVTQLAVIDANNPNPLLAGNRTTITDRFGTRNQFYGGQIGLRGRYAAGPVWVAVRGEVALGGLDREIEIAGRRDVNSATGSFVVPVGQLALPSNSGRFTDSTFSVVPEVGVSAGYQVTEHVAVSVGYTFVGVTRAVRPGQQIDLVTDPTQIPRPGQPIVPSRLGLPAVPFAASDYWAQGVTFGVQAAW